MQLNQYYTEDIYGDVLVDSFSSFAPRIALDLGFGSGSLLNAAQRRWNELSLIGIDIDNKNVDRANLTSTIKAIEYNGFDPSLPEIIKDRFGEIDLLVGNPPYFSREFDQDAKKILNSIGMLECIPSKAKKIPAELIFIAQNLRLLSKTGELGLIVPAGLVSGEKWKLIREYLLTEYSVSRVIQLPTNSFKNTDAQTFILIIQQKSSDTKSITISHINSPKHLTISLKEAFQRADYTYYKSALKQNGPPEITANDFVLFRGNKSKNQLNAMGANFLHTTDIPSTPSQLSLRYSPMTNNNNSRPGDILIARVGRRCLGKVLYVQKGSLPISDCIIVIRPHNQQSGRKIWEKLSQPSCRNYLSEVSLGVGAKYLTYTTITEYLTTGSHATSRKL
ncbi:N-6 DNA methylase [Methylophaga nitratireducenticrescens]|uniref:N-6 DNA methylase n=1 Tax=Methylophaga nitratireducenticrescens TaxID=754476 RepID=UPI000CDC79EF|nr:N-6 DNA methylase [Methylophaga nitratireducenticrescens]AUZ83798.1 hypothetical protein CDW43_04075 [Methylophaga nitratireducenticrescens]